MSGRLSGVAKVSEVSVISARLLDFWKLFWRSGRSLEVFKVVRDRGGHLGVGFRCLRSGRSSGGW